MIELAPVISAIFVGISWYNSAKWRHYLCPCVGCTVQVSIVIVQVSIVFVQLYVCLCPGQSKALVSVQLIHVM